MESYWLTECRFYESRSVPLVIELDCNLEAFLPKNFLKMFKTGPNPNHYKLFVSMRK